ncbi:MAG: hypothetical protein OEZ58_01390 [Gammaproteobacteria bacterium]|nr:hypothetical protein [Gammaproteobacteria bacterium]
MKTKSIFALLILNIACVAQVKSETHLLDLGKDMQLSIVEHKISIEKCSKPCLPNGDFVFGAAGSQPSSYVKQISFKWKNKSFELDSANMYNAWGDRPVKDGDAVFAAAHCYDFGACTIRLLLSDAGGAYVAEWLINQDKVFRSILTYSNDVTNLFIDRIHPPVFE